MTRKCSHCGHNGHNSRTCPERGFKLFGVRLTMEGMRKSVSMGNLANHAEQGAEFGAREAGGDGYVSDGLVQTSSHTRERKKGVPWTEEEHRSFLMGLQKLGKGDWRGISKNFVMSRTPTQVASHAQKYFIRQSNISKRKRRSSLFDIPSEVDVGYDSQYQTNQVDLQQLTINNASHQSMRSFNEAFPLPMVLDTVKEDEVETGEKENDISTGNVAEGPAFIPVPVPVPVPVGVPVWLGLGAPIPKPPVCSSSLSNVVKPTASVSRAPIRLDNGDLPQLRLGLEIEPSHLKLEEPSSRHSAFHTKASSSSFGNNLRDGKGLNVPISVV